MSICNPIAPAIGRHLAWMLGSKRERSKSFGAMGMRLGLQNRASGWWVSMKSQLSRSWSVIRSAERSLDRSSNRSSTNPAWDGEHVGIPGSAYRVDEFGIPDEE